MKKHVFTLGICLALLQVSKPAQAQTMAKAQTTPTETQAGQSPADETKAVASEKSILTTKASSDTGYDKGTVLLNAGITLGYYGYGYSGGSGFLPLSVNLEYSINDKFAVGPYVGFYSRKYSVDDRFTALSFGGRGTFHATGVLNDALNASMNAEKLDLYASAILGFETWKYKYNNSISNDANNTRLRLGVAVGVRYMFAPSVGAFFEVGPGAFGFATLGLSFKF